ncbi:MAG: MGMT family protein [Planctomycetota bacterium]
MPTQGTTRRLRMLESGDAMRVAFTSVMESLAVGEVTTYAEVAERAGYPRRHRAVGQFLSVNADALPWWRVVYASGHLPPCNPGLQEQRLADEGVTLLRQRVVDSPQGRFRRHIVVSDGTIGAERRP